MTTNPFSLLRLTAAKSTIRVVDKFPFPVDFTLGKFRKISIVVHNGVTKILHADVDVSTFSFVWISSGWDHRDLAYALRLYLESTKTPHSYTEESPSKITDCVLFALRDLPIPDTVYVNRSRVEKNTPLIKEVCGYPLIVKDTMGSRGNYLAYVASEPDLMEKMRGLPTNKSFLFQRYIPHDCVWGVTVANGLVVAGSQNHPSAEEFRSNLCLGGEEVFIEVPDIPQAIREIAIKASGHLGLGWSRADIIIDKRTGLPYLLEVNRNPGITAGSDEVNGAYTYLAAQILPLCQGKQDRDS